MADDSQFSTETQPTLQQLADYVVDSFFDVHKIKRVETAVKNAVAEGSTVAKAVTVEVALALAEVLGKFLSASEQLVEPIAAPALVRLAGHLLGRELSTSDLRRAASAEGETVIGGAVADLAFGMMAPPEGDIQPSSAGARRMMGTMSQLVFNGWFEATAFELLTTLFPDMDSFESVAELPHDLIQGLGLGRLSRTALRPLAHLLIATPLEWELNKKHHPKLLSEGTVAHQWARGRWDWADVVEELERQGYNEERINAVINEQRKFISVAEVNLIARHVGETNFVAEDYLNEAGYTTADAHLALLAAETQRIEAHETALATLAIDAYGRRDIDDLEFTDTIRSVVTPQAEQDRLIHLGALRRQLDRRFLTSGQVEAAVLAKVLPIAAYRAALAREGYAADDVLTLELLLETKINDRVNVDQLRKQKQDEAAHAKADAAAKAQAREQQIAEQRRLKAEGPLDAWKRAVVTGLVPLAAYQALLAERYDGATVATLTALAQQERAAYLAQQQKAEDAAKRAADKGLNIGQLAQAVYSGVLTVGQFRQALAVQQLGAADADVLTATVSARLADLTAAKQKRADAETRAGKRTIDLSRFELLVRRGHRTMADYRALLASLGYDEASIAAMADLLALKVTDDEAARQTRAAVAAKRDAVSLSFAQLRRAVVLGDAPVDDFARFLVANHFTPDAQAVLVAELRDDVAEAAAARARRAKADESRVQTRLAVATLDRAARLGLITADDYRAALVARGYSADDVAIELDLLAIEIQDTQQRRAAAEAARARAADQGLSLAQLATAVKLGEATLDDYRSRAIALGFNADDVATLAAVVEDEAAAAADARARHEQIAAQLKPRNLSLSELDQSVIKGLLTIDAYRARIVAFGFSADDADLLVALLQLKLGAGAGGPGGTTTTGG